MAETQVTGGFGCLFKRGDGAGTEVFTTVAEVVSIGGPSLGMDPIEATHMESPNATREFIAGLKDGGEVTLELNFLPANATFTGLTTDWANRTKRNFKIQWTNTANTVWSFTGFITNIEPGAQVDDKLTVSVTIKVTGSPTFA